jgi:5-methylcytosine-specific restriction protein A
VSRVAPKSGEPVVPPVRGPMPPKRRARVMLAAGGRCGFCHQKITAGQPWIANHIVPLELGGADEIGNLEPLHADPCDKIITSGDLKRIAKMRRQNSKNLPSSDENVEPKPSKRRIVSAGFDETKTRRFDGKVVSRVAR